MDTCICMAESLCCPPETIIIFLIGSTPIQNKKFFLKNNCYSIPEHLLHTNGLCILEGYKQAVEGRDKLRLGLM